MYSKRCQRVIERKSWSDLPVARIVVAIIVVVIVVAIIVVVIVVTVVIVVVTIIVEGTVVVITIRRALHGDGNCNIIYTISRSEVELNNNFKILLYQL